MPACDKMSNAHCVRGAFLRLHSACIVVFLLLLGSSDRDYGASLVHVQHRKIFLGYDRLFMSSSAVSGGFSQQPNIVPVVADRIQRIKNIGLKRQILNDITNSEFALRLELKTESRTIDFDRLINKLEENLAVIQSRDFLSRDVALSDRIVKTKEDLYRVKNGQLPIYVDSLASGDAATAPVQSATSTDSATPEKADLVKELQESLDIRLIVREDGTVDWDGAVASGREVAKFGKELWVRLNGKEEELPTISELFGQVQSKQPESPNMAKLSLRLSTGRKLLEREIQAKTDLSQRLRTQRRAGQEIASEDVLQLRRLDLRVKEVEKWVKILSIDLDVERISAYLEQELETCADPNDPRPFIAEAALVDKRYASLLSGLQMPDLDTLSALETNEATVSRVLDNVVSLVDEDELSLVIIEVQDLMYRLGLETQRVATVDWGSLGKVSSDVLNKIRVALTFIADGTKLLFSDVEYVWKLLIKAAQGYTLKPREVNALRRTGKDLLTLIPVTIILIIPLSPVGHVLVFSFIQRFFPDFFPSSYTEQRLNLKKLFSEIERKQDGNIDDILGEESVPSFSQVLQERLESLKGALSNLLAPAVTVESDSK